MHAQSTRKKTREKAVQALYQRVMSSEDALIIEQQFHAMDALKQIDKPYFHTLLHGVIHKQMHLDKLMLPWLDRPVEQLGPIELSILRLGCFELAYCQDIPYRVVINEGVGIAKRYGAQNSYKYINSILDQVSISCRIDERQANQNENLKNTGYDVDESPISDC
ncbi:MAG: transcription antitermination factor NusB [Endozoicomonadaceae bacterium]|nr:transcription antitermination factor NusB [Endozoicomonadaceae bacterium]